eukprot:CAMPEP_0174718824 /NCGR_PEP_ID=MMETSP1094-20130205/30091_1 /TAXON_ID=156173 /ORGANISM="Chrysochromulina brevifilum, Strain UTEX LB 985" /LENGTH=480 /DNA_ID=CAMNT_0015919023 /DNA_START=15 /DNA_END=1457 /DNA_ORIENTATION=+
MSRAMCRGLALCLAAVGTTQGAFLGDLAGRRSSPARRAAEPHTLTMSAAPKVVKLGLVGGGTVGGGIVEILTRKAEFFTSSLGVDTQVTKIVVGNPDKPRDFAVPMGCEITTDVNDVIDDPDIDVVVEVMGGVTLAKDVVFRSLKAGKHVVTANKALIAQDLPEIEALIKSINADRDEPVQFGYEAAVCGGIPIIHTLQGDFIGDDVVQLSGIINGCTNFMLSSMAGGGKSYADALAEASELGYAEADPTLDVGGFDARSKLRIMIKLAFGLNVEEEEIPVRGITEITQSDFDYASSIGGTIKLLGVAKKDATSDFISAFVSPCFVDDSSTLANINGATNAVQITSTSLQDSTFVGQGAGRFPTANSCVSDILAVCQGKTSQPFPKVAPPSLGFRNSYTSGFFVRIRFRDGVGIIKTVGEVFAECGVSIYSILQNPIKDPNDSQFVVMTDPIDVAAVKAACVKIEATDWCLGDTFYMPVL